MENRPTVQRKDYTFDPYQELTTREKNMQHLPFTLYMNQKARREGIEYADAHRLIGLHAEYRTKQRSERIKVSMDNYSWDTVLRPLTDEICTIRSRVYAQRKSKRNPALLEALEAYLQVLFRVRAEIKATRIAFPGARVRAVTSHNHFQALKGRFQVRKNGAHWKNWVPTNVRSAIIKAFSDAYNDKARHARWSAPSFPDDTDKDKD